MNLPDGYCLQNGKYCLTRVIGQGGFGITYLGEWNTEVKGELGAVETAVPICIKEYFFKDYCFRDETTFEVKVHSGTGKILFDKFKERQIEEAKILSEVHHPYIVNVLEVFEENNTAYIAMEHISGCSLKSMLSEQTVLPESKVLKYVAQIGKALEFVHQKNILHLDIKPNNILIDKNDNARLIDFGVSKRYDLEEQEACTTTLTLSKGFASIEQYDDEGTVNFSPCPDVYSLGATMYNLLTGVIPVESILRATKPLVHPSELNKRISPKTEAVVLKAMQVNPKDRYQSIKEMIDALDIPPSIVSKENISIPRKKEHEAEQSVDENESTQLIATSCKPGSTDNEETIFIPSKTRQSKQRRTKSKRRILLPLLIFAFAGVSWAVSYLFSWSDKNTTFINNKLVADASMQQGEPIIPVDLQPQREAPLKEQSPSEVTNEIHKAEQTEKKERNETALPIKKEEKSEKTTTSKESDKKGSEEASNAKKTEEETERMNANYAALLVSGKIKMNQGHYVEAKADFTKAKEIKITEDVVRLSLACEEKIEEKNIADRIALYESGMTFGNYTIVRKKQNGRYGAIDAKGIERIKCIYLSVGRSESGRAFEREDRLYDIYNSNGVLVGKGLTTY
ncbi:protein kinase domain-containing protein [Tannerella sp.]|uniref:serine/threonine protein kinase n=1 Tax=Tannerella sp. TaxID=2382127 RepID=UPI003FA1FD8B